MTGVKLAVYVHDANRLSLDWSTDRWSHHNYEPLYALYNEWPQRYLVLL